MRFKNEQEIEEAYMDKFYDSKDDFQDEESFVKGALWMQQDIIASTSEGFEEWIRKPLNKKLFGYRNAMSGEYAKKAWQAAKMSNAKEMQEKDTEIERLRKEVKDRNEEMIRLNHLLAKTANDHLIEAHEVRKLQKEKQEMREVLNQAVKILEEGCLVYDQHVPSGSSSFRVDADMFMKDVSKCYNLSETPNSSKEGV